MFAAILDTNVLWPSLQRDFLLSMGAAGLYRPLWSRDILDELEYHEAEKLRDRGVEEPEVKHRVARLLQQMQSAFIDAEVTGYEPLIGKYGSADPDDEHVIAAAQMGGAGVIVTENDKHFPVSVVPPGIQVERAKVFAANTVDTNPTVAARVLREMAARYRNPYQSAHDILDVLVSRYGMADVDEIVRPALDELTADGGSIRE